MESTENNVRNIVKEIMREIYPKNISVYENFVTYYVQLLLLDPNWGITHATLTDRDHIDNFVKHVVKMLENQNVPGIVTLKMQFYFACNFDNRFKLIQNNRSDLKHHLEPLRNNIVNNKSIEKDALVAIHKKLTYYTTLAAGLGNPTIEDVYDETYMALKSVLFEDELKQFVMIDRYEKESQIEQLVELVMGVRLFNKDCNKGGAGIEDLPSMLEKILIIIKVDSQNMLLAVMDQVNILTTFLDRTHKLMGEHDYRISYDFGDKVEIRDIEYAKDMLILYRQYEIFLRKICVEIEKIGEQTSEKSEALKALLRVIHDLVFLRIAIPADQIFPLFEKLARIWTALQDLVLLLTQLNQILINLQMYTELLSYDSNYYETQIGEKDLKTGAMTDAERLERTSSCTIPIPWVSKKVQVLSSRCIGELNKVHLEYLGFCCWSLVQTNGGLIPGNPNMGIIVHKGLNYAFSTVQAAVGFSMDPKMYNMDVLNLARNKPQLINFLQLKEQLIRVKDKNVLLERPVAPVAVTVENSNQTVVHLEEDGYIDPHYMWNVWDLKRDALKMADLVKKKTVSSQTDKVFTRCPVHTQTYSVKDQEVQTKKDGATNVPKPSNFIYGLRGRKDNKQFIIELTRPVTE